MDYRTIAIEQAPEALGIDQAQLTDAIERGAIGTQREAGAIVAVVIPANVETNQAEAPKRPRRKRS